MTGRSFRGNGLAVAPIAINAEGDVAMATLSPSGGDLDGNAWNMFAKVGAIQSPMN